MLPAGRVHRGPPNDSPHGPPASTPRAPEYDDGPAHDCDEEPILTLPGARPGDLSRRDVRSPILAVLLDDFLDAYRFPAGRGTDVAGRSTELYFPGQVLRTEVSCMSMFIDYGVLNPPRIHTALSSDTSMLCFSSIHSKCILVGLIFLSRFNPSSGKNSFVPSLSDNLPKSSWWK